MDQNKYINTYIDIAIGQLHEFLGTNLQLKAQVKIANDLLQEKDQIISNLQAHVESIKNNDTDVEKANEQSKYWEDSYHAMKNKVAHMETLLNQLKDMKAIITEKDKEISSMKATIDELKAPKKVINTKAKLVPEKPIKEKQPTDDF